MRPEIVLAIILFVSMGAAVGFIVACALFGWEWFHRGRSQDTE